MKEVAKDTVREKEDRLKRLRARKNELLEKMKTLRDSTTVRNAAHKLDLINDEVTTITIKIMELQER